LVAKVIGILNLLLSDYFESYAYAKPRARRFNGVNREALTGRRACFDTAAGLVTLSQSMDIARRPIPLAAWRGTARRFGDIEKRHK
jgi:hypothetical protein